MMNAFFVKHAKKLLAAAAVTAAAAALGAPLTEQERTLVGTWYGEFQPAADKPVQRFLIARKDDGSFELQARIYEAGKPTGEIRNKGLWGVSNGLYFTVTTEVSGRRTDLRTAEVTNPYVVRSLAQDAFEYQHIASGNQFRVVRVDAASAKLP